MKNIYPCLGVLVATGAEELLGLLVEERVVDGFVRSVLHNQQIKNNAVVSLRVSQF